MLRKLETITSPSELMDFLSAEIKYGFVKRSSGKILTNPATEEWRNCWTKEYFLQNPAELLRSKHGVCWDYVELERYWFQSLGYEIKTFYMAVIMEGENRFSTHTFLAYLDQDKWYWFENSWHNQRGIREYATLNELLIDASNQHAESLISQGATAEDIQNHKLYEYKNSLSGATPIDFVLSIINDNLPVSLNKEAIEEW